MKFTIVVLESPYNHQASDTAYHFAEATLASGHEIQGIFFYCDGVYNASSLTDPPTDDRSITKRWSALGARGVDLVVCIAAGKRRGIVNACLADNFRISGLGQLADMVMKSDRSITFGD